MWLNIHKHNQEALLLTIPIQQSLEWQKMPRNWLLVLLISFTVVAANLAIDLLYGILDPRIRTA